LLLVSKAALLSALEAALPLVSEAAFQLVLGKKTPENQGIKKKIKTQNKLN
jgi:hypothetical protein